MSLIKLKIRKECFASDVVTAERDVSRLGRRAKLTLRFTGLGGHDMGALIFPTDYAGPLSIYCEKIDRIVRDDEGNDDTDFGTALEDTLRDTLLPTFLVRRCGLAPDQFRIYLSPWLYRSKGHSWKIGNVDGVIEFLVDFTTPDGQVIPAGLYVLELKTADHSQREGWAELGTPNNYYAQAQHYTGLMVFKGALIFALLVKKPIVRFLPLHEGFQSLIDTTGSDMWKRIEERNPPPAFGGDADLSAVRSLYSDAGADFTYHPGLEEPAWALHFARLQRKKWEAEIKTLEAQLKSATGSAAGLTSEKARVTWTRKPGKTFDVDAFKATYPDLFGRFKTKDKPYQRLTVSVKGEISEE